MTNNTFTTTAAPTPVRTRIELLEHKTNATRRQLRFIAEGRKEATAEEIRELEDSLKVDEGHLKGIYFMLEELSLHC